MNSSHDSQHEVTHLLLDWGNGDQSALDKLMPMVYEELRRLAHRYMDREKPDHTLQTSALVNEAYLRLIDQTRTRWRNRAQFFGIAAQSMRRILVDHARSHHYAKRGGGAVHVQLDEAAVLSDESLEDILELSFALDRLLAFDERKCRVVELKYFGGFTVEEIAEALEISKETVARDWSVAKSWLRRETRKESLRS
ncbi:MAG: hypothetical protein QOJ64_2073 [Acidobacteriota bacterium]|jgi:RNA polymerase sigma factor (TIGR02999 family)|nr:hypothetical protein [Acidobacteriota bacterium]